jgi:multiple sugar transport system substrate-binding protein
MEKNALVSKQLSRRSFLHAAAATAGVMVTAACAAPAPAGGSAMDSGDDAAMETVELRLAYWGFQVEKQGALQAAFQDTYPNIKLQEDITSWSNYWQKMLASTAAGESPDIMHHSPYYHVRFAHNGVTIPLDSFIERDGIDLDDFYEGAITQGRWQPGQIRCGSGDLHAFPTVWHSGTMWFWNKNWFAEKGIPDPDESWTWDTIVEAGKEFTVINDDGSAESYGMDKPVDGNSRMNFWIFQAGGAFYDEDYNGCLIKEDAPMEAFQWMTDLVNEHKVAMPPEANLQFNPFETGRVAFAVMGDWMIPSFSEIEEFEWDVFTPPAHPVTGQNDRRLPERYLDHQFSRIPR